MGLGVRGGGSESWQTLGTLPQPLLGRHECHSCRQHAGEAVFSGVGSGGPSGGAACLQQHPERCGLSRGQRAVRRGG